MNLFNWETKFIHWNFNRVLSCTWDLSWLNITLFAFHSTKLKRNLWFCVVNHFTALDPITSSPPFKPVCPPPPILSQGQKCRVGQAFGFQPQDLRNKIQAKFVKSDSTLTLQHLAKRHFLWPSINLFTCRKFRAPNAVKNINWH